MILFKSLQILFQFIKLNTEEYISTVTKLIQQCNGYNLFGSIKMTLPSSMRPENTDLNLRWTQRAVEFICNAAAHILMAGIMCPSIDSQVSFLEYLYVELNTFEG